jgi:hypothetical protein
MKKTHFFIVTLILSFSFSLAQTPQTFTWDVDFLVQARQKSLAEDKYTAPIVRKIIASADKMLLEPNVNVTKKGNDWQKYFSNDPPVSPNEFISFSTYYYPDTLAGKSLQDPWIKIEKRGGNREIRDKFDYVRLGTMKYRVQNCAKAYWFTNDAKYARLAASQLREWFINPQTRMLPDMNHAQFVPFDPVYKSGSAYGIIDLMDFHNLLNSVGLIENSGEWTKADETALKQWVFDLSTWLQTNRLGRKEGQKEGNNNHGIYYDILLITNWLYLGDNYQGVNYVQKAKDYLLTFVPDARILELIGNGQIVGGQAIDGGMWKELHRPGASGYSAMCLNGYAFLNLLAQKVNVDLYNWNSEVPDKRSIREAFEWNLPYLDGSKRWTFGDYQKNPFTPAGILNAFWISSTYVPSHFRLFNNYILTQVNPRMVENSEYNLLFPRPVVYYDDFMCPVNPAKNRTVFRGGDWITSNGELKLSNPSSELANSTPGNICLHSATIYDDFRILSSFKLNSEKPDAAMGMVFMANCDSVNENYYYVLLSKNSNESGIYKVKGNGTISGTTRTKITNFNTKIASKKLYSLNIQREGKTTTVWLDNKVIGTMKDSEFMSGKTGFCSQNAACSFQHVSVSKSAKNLLPFVTHISNIQDSINVKPGSSYKIEADAIDFDGSIAKLEFYTGNTKLAETTKEPYSFTWNNIPTGNSTVRIVAMDNEGGRKEIAFMISAMP